MDLNSALSQLVSLHKRGDFEPEGAAKAAMAKLLARRSGAAQAEPLGPVAAMGLAELEVAILLQEAVAMGTLSLADLDPASRARFFE